MHRRRDSPLTYWDRRLPPSARRCCSSFLSFALPTQPFNMVSFVCDS